MPDGYRLLWAGWYRLEDGAGPYAWDGAAGFALIGSGRGASAGGGALLEGETNGFATDFTHAVDAERVAVKTAGTVVASGLDAFYQNTSTSSKQVFDVSGNLVWAPHNLFLQSQTFDNASWSKSALTVTANAAAAPDGTMTADALVPPAGTVSPFVTQSGAVINGSPVTFSLYMKNGTLGSPWIEFQIASGTNKSAWFNIVTGLKGTTAGGMISSNMIVLADGWYRCDATFTAGAATAQPYIAVRSGDGASGAISTGDGVKIAFYLWGAQLNRGTVPTAYLPTTTAARYGLAVDYDPVTHAAKGLLCEPAATNLLLNSTTLSTQSVTVTAVTHTLSFWGTGTITNSGVSTTVLVGTGVNDRVQVSFLPTAGSLTLTVTGTVTRAQLEIGTVATSPIPTFAATATRTLDNYNVTPASINHSATAGSWWVDVELPFNSLATPKIIGYTTTSSSPMSFRNTGTHNFALNDSTSLTKTIGSALGLHKAASAWQLGDRAITADGLAVVTDAGSTTVLLAPGAAIGFGNAAGTNTMTGWIRKIRYLPRRKINSELVTETVP